MTTIDREHLRKLAEKANEPDASWKVTGEFHDLYSHPRNHLALLDALDAAEARVQRVGTSTSTAPRNLHTSSTASTAGPTGHVRPCGPSTPDQDPRRQTRRKRLP